MGAETVAVAIWMTRGDPLLIVWICLALLPQAFSGSSRLWFLSALTLFLEGDRVVGLRGNPLTEMA